MDVELRIEGQVANVAVAGEVDVATSDRFRECCELGLADATTTLRIDLFGVTFMDSTAVAALVHVQRRANAAQQVVILEDLQPQVRRVFDLTGLTDFFVIN